MIKNILRLLIPKRLINLLYTFKPSITPVNTYLLKREDPIINLKTIDKKYIIRELNVSDTEQIKQFYYNYKNILPRLETNAWVGLAVFDTTTGSIAYISWIIKETTDFISEFDIKLSKNQFWVRHGYCHPQHRHQGLHTRMEQERINYCINNGANEIYIQIGSKNIKGHESVTNNGFQFIKKNYTIRIPALSVYRDFFSFLKSPFKRVI